MIEKVFRDPVHNYVHVEQELIYHLINTKEFQRLRRIKQLGTTSYTFHGGEHSRFSHCLGAYEIARRITQKFEDKYPDIWDSNESEITEHFFKTLTDNGYEIGKSQQTISASLAVDAHGLPIEFEITGGKSMIAPRLPH